MKRSRAAGCVRRWGFTDLHSWLGVAAHALPWDESHRRKPAYYGLRDGLAGR